MREAMRYDFLVQRLCVVSLWVLLSLAVCLAFSGCDKLKIETPKTDVVIKTEEAEIVIPGIPQLAYRLKRQVIGEARYWWGESVKCTIFFSQIHQESCWNPAAKSKYASGLAQFTPDTAKWISNLYPKDLGENKPEDIRWAIRALVRYDKLLYDKSTYAETNDDQWSFTLSGYNGGSGWIDRDRKLAVQNGRSDKKWICNVQHYSSRADWAIKENRDYVEKILRKWVPLYQKGGFV